MKKTISCIFLLVLVVTSCKKDTTSKLAQNSDSETAKWTIMSNPTDPMFAKVETTKGDVEYYGERDARGFPSKLRSFIVKDKKESITYQLDEIGKLTSIQHSNGIRFNYIYKDDKAAGVIITGPGNFKLLVPLNSNKSDHGSATSKQTGLNQQNFNNSNGQTTTREAKGNITVNVTQCGKPVTSNIGEVSVQLKTIQGGQQITLLPTTYSNGVYTASLPRDVANDLIPSAELCSDIAEIVSTICNVITADGAKEMGAQICAAIGIGISLGTINPELAPFLTGLCESGVIWAGIACTATADDGAILNKLCNATYQKRIYGQGIYLQPQVYYNGSLILGDLTSTIGGNQSIALSLELGCNPPNIITLNATSVTQTSAVLGGTITDNGGSQITERGILWGTSANPTTKVTEGGTGTGTYTVNLNSLTPNTTYYVQAYATNDKGTGYGNEITFTTSNEIQGTPGDPRFNLQFTNGTQVDLDLYVQTPNGSIIYYGNPTGQNGGQLDLDCYCSFCPNGPNENIYWTPGTAAAGTYKVWVNYFGGCDGSNSVSTYTLRILKNDVIIQTYTGTLTPSNTNSTMYTFDFQ